MLSRSCLDLLNLVSVDDYGALRRIPKDMVAPGVVSNFEVRDDSDSGAASDDAVSSVSQERRITVANQLSIKSFRDKETRKWIFEFDSDSIYLQLKDGFPSDVEVIYVGSLKANIVDPSEQEEVSQIDFRR
ncbi:hypothetical protein K1719_007211 [Acacia pycnantha]|nr:hypothetical protein K1719_007211 [Acacia pycnantha]